MRLFELNFHSFGLTSAALALMVMAPNLRAQSAATSTGTPDISGFWELRYYSRNIPKAQLTAAAAKADAKAQAEKEDRKSTRLNSSH